MLKTTARILLTLIAILPLGSCEEKDDRGIPGFSEITVSPEKDVYEVGDQVTCTIRMTSPAYPTLKKSTYWWYTSGGSRALKIRLIFKSLRRVANVYQVQSPSLSRGDVKLYFFGRLEYPNYDWEKIEISKPLK